MKVRVCVCMFGWCVCVCVCVLLGAVLGGRESVCVVWEVCVTVVCV